VSKREIYEHISRSGGLECVAYPVGTYSFVLGAYMSMGGALQNAICSKCDKGKYASGEGSSVCLKFSAEKKSRAHAAFLEDTCTICPAGCRQFFSSCRLRRQHRMPFWSELKCRTKYVYMWCSCYITHTCTAITTEFVSNYICTRAKHNTQKHEYVFIVIGFDNCSILFFYFRFRNWRNQQEINIVYEIVELDSTTTETQLSDDPIIRRTTQIAESPEEST